MSDNIKLASLRELIETAEASIASAKQILADLGVGNKPGTFTQFARRANELEPSSNADEGAIEGIFDGQSMIGPDRRGYPVPANYASKSKLVPGDILKLNIKDDGTFVYKQIKPAERKHVIGILTNDDGQYKVICTGKAYNVLLASVTYYRAQVGDKVTLVVPANEDSQWGAIENVLPRTAVMENEELGVERL